MVGALPKYQNNAHLVRVVSTKLRHQIQEGK
jgi:hypothetical protein